MSRPSSTTPINSENYLSREKDLIKEFINQYSGILKSYNPSQEDANQPFIELNKKYLPIFTQYYLEQYFTNNPKLVKDKDEDELKEIVTNAKQEQQAVIEDKIKLYTRIAEINLALALANTTIDDQSTYIEQDRWQDIWQENQVRAQHITGFLAGKKFDKESFDEICQAYDKIYPTVSGVKSELETRLKTIFKDKDVRNCGDIYELINHPDFDSQIWSGQLKALGNQSKNTKTKKDTPVHKFTWEIPATGFVSKFKSSAKQEVMIILNDLDKASRQYQTTNIVLKNQDTTGKVSFETLAFFITGSKKSSEIKNEVTRQNQDANDFGNVDGKEFGSFKILTNTNAKDKKLIESILRDNMVRCIVNKGDENNEKKWLAFRHAYGQHNNYLGTYGCIDKNDNSLEIIYNQPIATKGKDGEIDKNTVSRRSAPNFNISNPNSRGLIFHRAKISKHVYLENNQGTWSLRAPTQVKYTPDEFDIKIDNGIRNLNEEQFNFLQDIGIGVSGDNTKYISNIKINAALHEVESYKGNHGATERNDLQKDALGRIIKKPIFLTAAETEVSGKLKRRENSDYDNEEVFKYLLEYAKHSHKSSEMGMEYKRLEPSGKVKDEASPFIGDNELVDLVKKEIEELISKSQTLQSQGVNFLEDMDSDNIIDNAFKQSLIKKVEKLLNTKEMNISTGEVISKGEIIKKSFSDFTDILRHDELRQSIIDIYSSDKEYIKVKNKHKLEYFKMERLSESERKHLKLHDTITGNFMELEEITLDEKIERSVEQSRLISEIIRNMPAADRLKFATSASLNVIVKATKELQDYVPGNSVHQPLSVEQVSSRSSSQGIS